MENEKKKSFSFIWFEYGFDNYIRKEKVVEKIYINIKMMSEL